MKVVSSGDTRRTSQGSPTASCSDAARIKTRNVVCIRSKTAKIKRYRQEARQQFNLSIYLKHGQCVKVRIRRIAVRDSQRSQRPSTCSLTAADAQTLHQSNTSNSTLVCVSNACLVSNRMGQIANDEITDMSKSWHNFATARAATRHIALYCLSSLLKISELRLPITQQPAFLKQVIYV